MTHESIEHETSPRVSRREKVITAIGALVIGSGLTWAGLEIHNTSEPFPEVSTSAPIDGKRRAELDAAAVDTLDWLYSKKYSQIDASVIDGDLTIRGYGFRNTVDMAFEGTPMRTDEPDVRSFLHGSERPHLKSLRFRSATVGDFTVTITDTDNDTDNELQLSITGTSFRAGDLGKQIVNRPIVPLAQQIIDAVPNPDPLSIPPSSAEPTRVK